jgi:hypothetical protein
VERHLDLSFIFTLLREAVEIARGAAQVPNIYREGLRGKLDD